MSFKFLSRFVLVCIALIISVLIYYYNSTSNPISYSEWINDKIVNNSLRELKKFESDFSLFQKGEVNYESLTFPSELSDDFTMFNHLRDTYAEQKNYGDDSEETEILRQEIMSYENAIKSEIAKLRERILETYVERNQGFHEKRRSGANKLLRAMFVLLPLLSVCTIAMIRSVRKPLDEMAEAMREVRKENFSYSLPIDEERSDELTQLKRDFNIMIRKLEILHRRTEESREQLQHDAKQLKESVVSKTRFIRHLGHELRSPLAAISSFSELMLEGIHGDITVKQEASLQRIMVNAQNLLDLVNDLVDQAKAEAGSLELKLEPKDLKAFCEEVLESVKIEAEKSGLKVIYHASEEDLVCDIHEVRLRQVIVNLISNAIKFSKQGGKLELSVQRKGGLAFIEVEDDGVGISPADQRNIFMEFHQGDTYQKEKGAGLGLHLSRQIARLHGGDITVVSEKGKGSVFRVQLPLSNQKV